MTNKEIRAVLEPALYDHVAAKSKAAGMTKAKWIAHLIEQDMASPKLTDSDRMDETNLHFEAGQVIDGQQNKTYKMLWASFEASQKTSKFSYLLSNKLGVLCRVEGKARSGNKKLKVMATFPGDPVRINKDGTFLKVYPDGGIEWFTKSELEAMSEPTAAVKPIEEEAPALVEEVPLAPIDEPVVEQLETPIVDAVTTEPLTKKKFQARYSVEGNAYGVICQQGKDSGWTAPDNSIWFYDTKAKLWSTAIPTTSQLELAFHK